MELIQIYKEKGLPVSKVVKLLSIPRSTYYSSLSLKEDKLKKKKAKGRPLSKTTYKFINSSGKLNKVTISDETIKEEIINLFSNEFSCFRIPQGYMVS